MKRLISALCRFIGMLCLYIAIIIFLDVKYSAGFFFNPPLVITMNCFVLMASIMQSIVLSEREMGMLLRALMTVTISALTFICLFGIICEIRFDTSVTFEERVQAVWAAMVGLVVTVGWSWFAFFWNKFHVRIEPIESNRDVGFGPGSMT